MIANNDWRDKFKPGFLRIVREMQPDREVPVVPLGWAGPSLRWVGAGTNGSTPTELPLEVVTKPPRTKRFAKAG